MISLSHLNKFKLIVIFFSVLIFSSVFAATPVDIWKSQDGKSQGDDQVESETDIIIKSPILSDEINKITIEIDEQEISRPEQEVIGIFDPEENNFNLNMWTASDGEDIKKILKRINKLKLSKTSENLLVKVLFTNAYPPKINLTSDEFLKIKIDWLIKNRRIKDLETLLKNNPGVGKESQAIKFLINEYLSSAQIKLACEKINFIDRQVQNSYLDKFTVYCLINNDRKNEAQLIFDLLKEKGLKDKFFEDKINFLLGFKENTIQKIKDDNLLNFYLSHITINNFDYEPSDKTDKYIWRYLSSVNLISMNDLENENLISTYEKAALDDSFKKEEIFNIYKQILFCVNQLMNATEVHKNLPGYKARALIYQKTILSENIEKKLYLAFLLKDLFIKDKLLKIYSEELLNILSSIDKNKIPENYKELVKINLEKNLKSSKKIEFDNDILHRSKVLRHFLDNNNKINRTEKDFKSVYKKIKKNKKYFISINDIIVLESLEGDGISLPKDLDFSDLSSQLTVPQNLEDLLNKNQVGLVMLKIIEIIGEDKVSDLDPETIYFLNKILNQLNLKKIRNNILSEALAIRV